MKSKYWNKKVEIDGIVFDSKKEDDYYLYLKRFQGSEANKKIY